MAVEQQDSGTGTVVRELLETTCDLERVAVVFNPVSGTLDLLARRTSLEELAQRAGLQCELEETDVNVGARPLAEKAVKHHMERLLVSGGDGSVTEAADALAGTPVALAVLPGGTGNLLALNLGIPTDPEEAMRLALNGVPQPFDVGRANGHVFLIMVGMGADARMIRDADRASKRRFGVFAYFIAAFRHLGRHHTLYRITVDGRRIRRRAQTVMVANVGKITGGIELVPGTDPHDGILEVAILRARTIGHLGRLLGRALVGASRSDNLLEVQRGRHIIIESARPHPVQLDGNEGGNAVRLEVTVEPGALKLISPSPEGAGTAETMLTLASGAGPRAWLPALVAAGTAVALYRRRQQSAESTPASFPIRYPILTGLAAGVVTGAILRKWRTELKSVSTTDS